MNKVSLMGRLTADPEIRTTVNGVNVTNFTLAVNRRFKNEQGKYEADFINCVAWRATAEFIAKHFQKGRMLAISGSIQTRNYEDKSGNKRTAVEVVCDEAYFCGEGKATKTQDGFVEVEYDQDLPF